ncbi:hypothetical protein L4D06_21845 [Enterovibrio makurazakiensis]|uniref:Twin-arginine translocation pathway signal n=1 Tax=Enterovibrio gelatinilyticus TaxID=2899819 RepID=A0ABT5QXH7_9GAMM|nr:hypothetical protein [Enterovibrio sp. ZSDZ42]MDD1792236.1 hypothetical protein [Enterovibrio sp. ZSDZ42]
MSNKKPSKKSEHLDNTAMSRRKFITNSTAALASVSVLAMGVGGVLVSPSAWASTVIGNHASKTLMVMSRDIYPHDDLEDKYYTRLLLPLGESANTDADLKKLLIEGVAELDKRSNQAFNSNYINIDNEKDRVTVLRNYENSAFFQKIKGILMMGLYNSPDLWPWFGYGGSAWEHGGYINRGYADIDWI